MQEENLGFASPIGAEGNLLSIRRPLGRQVAALTKGELALCASFQIDQPEVCGAGFFFYVILPEGINGLFPNRRQPGAQDMLEAKLIEGGK